MIPHLYLCFLQSCNKSLLLTKLARDRIGRISALGLFVRTERSEVRTVKTSGGPIFSQCGPRAWLIRYMNPRHRFEFVQKIVESFWRRWNMDAFPALVPRKKWQVEKRNVRIDDMVIVADNNAIRGKWTYKRIMEVYPAGSDGRVVVT